MDEEEIDESTIPNEFLCPIYQELMRDPVITVDGFTFERRGIEEWFKKGKSTNPLTGKALSSKELIENRALRNVIEHHNERVRNIEAVATANAQALIQSANETIKEEFPELLDDSGYVQLDRVYEIFKNYSNVQEVAQELTKLSLELKPKIKECKECKDCQSCKASNNLQEGVRNLLKLIKNKAENVLKEAPIYSEKMANYRPEEINYIILSNESIKMIDFKRIKKSDLKLKSIKGMKLKSMTLGEILRRIKNENEKELPPQHEIRIWKADKKLDEVYDHISSDSESVTGPYISRVRGVGERQQTLTSKLNEINYKEKDYLIIEHFKNEEYVFRDEVIKCDFCYRSKDFYKQCNCRKVNYCSAECMNKDIEYHNRVCPLIRKD